jgi:Holliday junction resolvase
VVDFTQRSITHLAAPRKPATRKAAISRGHQRERDLVRLLRSEGWIALRAPASLGVFDVMAARDGEVRLIEVKSTARSAFAGFPPADRAELLEAARVAGASPWLYWHPPRKEPRWVGPDEWP